ncbi:MAG: hypothetical protein AB7S75_06525 [Desulfococcaceae bacterium]
MLQVLKMVSALIAASIIGNWFLAEVRKSRLRGEPWYKPYGSPPGILILVLLLALPVIVWMLHK